MKAGMFPQAIVELAKGALRHPVVVRRPEFPSTLLVSLLGLVAGRERTRRLRAWIRRKRRRALRGL